MTKQNVIYSYISQMVSVVSGFFISIILVKYLSVSEFGEYNFFLSSMILLGIVVSFGLEGVKQRYITEFLELKEYAKVNRLIFWTIAIRLSSLILVSGLLCVFYIPIKEHFSLTVSFSSFVVLALIFIFIKMRQLVGTALLTAYLKVYKDKINQIYYQIAKLILFYMVLINGYGLEELIYAWLIVEFGSFLHFFILAIKKIYNNKKNIIEYSSFTTEEKKRIFSFAKYQTFAVLLFMFADISLDNVMLGYYIDQNAVGMYAFALGILSLISRLNPSLLMRGMFSSMLTKLYTKNKNLLEVQKLYIIITKLTIVVVLPLYLIAMINIEKIILFVYDDKYLVTIPLIYMGVFFFVFRELIHPFNPLINTLEKNKLFLYTGVFSIYNGIANMILIPLYGIYGALFATGSAGIMIFYFYIYSFKKVFNRSLFPYKSFFKVILYILPVTFFCMMINNYISNIFLLILFIFVEFGIFYLILIKFKIFTQEERDMLNRQINKNIIKF